MTWRVPCLGCLAKTPLQETRHFFHFQPVLGQLHRYQNELQLSKKQYERWAGKRYLVLIEISEVESIEPFRIDKSDYGNMDDWLPVEQIEKVRI